MQIERKPDRTIHAVGARTLLGEIHLALGQSEAAEQIARDVLEGRTAYGAAWLLLADALLAQGKTVEIERVLADLEEVRGAETARAMIRAARLAREGALADALTSTPDGLDDALLSRFRGRLREGQTGAPLVACLQAPWS